MKFLNNILKKIKLFWFGIFYGLSKADKTIISQVDSSNGFEAIQQKAGGQSVFADMLEEKQTQQVKETVDAHYRIYQESQKYDTSSIVIVGEDEEGLIFSPITKLKKKSISDFMQHTPVYNPENAKIRTIQDNYHIQDNYQQNKSTLFAYETTLVVERNDFTPRFKIEKLVKKMVVREGENNKVLVDLYIPAEASQFGKTDAIIISNLYNLMENNIKKSDLTDIVILEWISDKAWNSEDIRLFKYRVIRLESISKYDGSLVLTYFCDTIENGKDLTEKYRTKELDKKYAIKAPKGEYLNIFELNRKSKEVNTTEINFNNLGNNKIKINNENCN